jgi:hypothetical protein
MLFLKPVGSTAIESFLSNTCNHLTLRKWFYTPLQHGFALDHYFAMLTFIFEPTNVIS